MRHIMYAACDPGRRSINYPNRPNRPNRHERRLHQERSDARDR